MENKNYDVKIIEVSERVISVTGEDDKAALDAARKLYKDEDVVLDYSDHVSTDFVLVPDSNSGDGNSSKKKPQTVAIKIPVGSFYPFVDESMADELQTVHIDRHVLLDWFRTTTLGSFRAVDGTDDGITDDGILDEWLDEYMPSSGKEAVSDLFPFALESYRPDVLHDMQYYSDLYFNKRNELIEKYRSEGCRNPETKADFELDDMALPEVDAGYWTYAYGANAYRRCTENIHASLITPKKLKVLALLKGLFDTRCSAKKELKPLEFADAGVMYAYIHSDNCRDGLYCPEHSLYAFDYSLYGSICVYDDIDEREARKLCRESRDGDEYWGAFLGRGGRVYDTPDDYGNGNGPDYAMAFCMDHYNLKWYDISDYTNHVLGEEADRSSAGGAVFSYSDTARSFNFPDGNSMYETLQKCDLYNPGLNNGTFMTLDMGCPVVYSDVSQHVTELSKEMRLNDLTGWNMSRLSLQDKRFTDADVCFKQYSACKGWVRADEWTSSDELTLEESGIKDELCNGSEDFRKGFVYAFEAISSLTYDRVLNILEMVGNGAA